MDLCSQIFLEKTCQFSVIKLRKGKGKTATTTTGVKGKGKAGALRSKTLEVVEATILKKQGNPSYPPQSYPPQE